jgi:hypothetical protein
MYVQKYLNVPSVGSSLCLFPLSSVLPAGTDDSLLNAKTSTSTVLLMVNMITYICMNAYELVL